MKFYRDREPDGAHGHDTEKAGEGPLVAIGLGGRLELSEGGIRITRGGVVGHLAALLWLSPGMGDKRIPLSQVTSIEVAKPIFFPDFVRVTYAGSPPRTGNYLADSLAENALLMNLIDNRAFHEIVRRVARAIGAPVPSEATVS